MSATTTLEQTTSKHEEIHSFAVSERARPLTPDEIEASIASMGSPTTKTRVFDVAPSNIVSRWRRITVTILIILANLLQMVSNCVGILGGVEISSLMGVRGVHATWVAASYPYVYCLDNLLEANQLQHNP